MAERGQIGPCAQLLTEERPDCPLCSQSLHNKKERKGTHIGPVLPERAPSEGPRSTAALRPTWVSFHEREASELGRKNRERPGAILARRTRTIGKCSFDARSKNKIKGVGSLSW
jgi:hypothetical protein